MKIRSVDARAFGPLESTTLDFADGFTVVWGPNEAAKSSWHAAIQAALSGRRRRTDAADKAFADRHRPWDGDAWRVGTVLELADGRRVSIERDLDARSVDVIDLDRGRPCDEEILAGGVPDAAVWLGLDRRTLAATALVRQTELAVDPDDLDPLRALLQRAASTLGGGSTAAEAVMAIDGFRRDHVGVDRANAVKPLRLAVVAERDAREELEERRRRHGEYLTQLAERDAASARVVELERRLTEVRAGRRRARLRATVEDGAHLLRLRNAIPESVVQDLDDDAVDELERLVADAVAAPPPRAVPERDVDGIRRQVAAMPDAAVGPTEEPASLRAAADAWLAASSRWDELDAPPDVESLEQRVGRLREANDAIASVVLPVAPVDADAELAGAVERRATLASRGRRSSVARLVAVVSLVGALVGVATGAMLPAGLAAVVAVLSTGASVALRPDGVAELDAEIAEWSERSAAAAAERQRAEQRRDAAIRRLEGLGIAPDTSVITVQEQLAAAIADVELARRAVSERSSLERRLDAAAGALRHELGAAGADAEADDLRAELHRLRSELVARRDVLTQRAELPRLEAELRAHADEVARADGRRRRRAELSERLLAALQAVGRPAPTPTLEFDQLVRHAREVVDHAKSARRGRVEAQRHRAAYEHHLAGRDADEVLGAAVAARDELTDDPGPEATEDDERAASAVLAEARAHESGVISRLDTVVPSDIDVAGAEAAVAAAERELDRVRRLQAVLEATTHHLTTAEEQAYRVVAPQLAAVVRQHLSTITEGRYVDATVDPETLAVMVQDADGRFRPSTALSHGTMEQVALLLRLAMTQVLTRAGEDCPFVLDDATVHADTGRTFALLTVLREAAREQQIIVFSQEQAVLDWASEHLGERDAVIDLTAA